jgi:hypothetical protein
VATRERQAAPIPRYLAVVRRGETEVYRILTEYLEARGLVQVVWDRREDQGGSPAAAASERRHTERQGPAHDVAYRTLGFFLARPDAPERPVTSSGRAG